jgi:hypothetical protein
MGHRVKAGLIQIGDALVEQIRNVTETVTDYPVQVERGYLFNPTPPSVDVYFGDVARDALSAAFDDVSGGYLFTVRARASTADSDAGQEILWRFADDTDELCLALAILDDPTLNGYASDVDVRDFTGLRGYEHPSGQGWFLGFQFTTLVLAGES